MRCDEVIRQMSAAGDVRDEPALAQHLAECEHCALWAERSARLDQLWDATRPADPAPEAWDRVWSSVEARLDQPARTAARPGRTARPTESILEDMPPASTRSARPW